MPENPSSLKMLKYIVDISEKMNKPLSICGELASDPYFIPLLIGLGFKNLSVDIHILPQIKKYLRQVSNSKCTLLAEACMSVSSATEVKDIMNRFGFSKDEDVKNHEFECIDPICRMIVHTEGNPLAIERDGKMYYFCSRNCLDQFARISDR